MEIIPEFVLIVAGSPLPGKDLGVFVRLVHARALRLDPNVKHDSRSFARIKYSLGWYGKLVDIRYIDNFYVQVLRYASQYLEKWELAIKVNYTEKEGET